MNTQVLAGKSAERAKEDFSSAGFTLKEETVENQ